MALGDSITFGTGSSSGGGYRDRLFHLAHAAGKTLAFVGSMQNGPSVVDGVAFPNQHEGYPGYTIGDPRSSLPGLAQLVVAEMAKHRPDIITLMIGTNDVNVQLDLRNAPKRLGRMIDEIVLADPNVLLVVAQIVPSTSDTLNAWIEKYNAGLSTLVRERTAAGKHVALVDMYGAFVRDAGFKTALLSDDLHPNDAGYERMAETWYATLAPMLR
jgi:lysophospholipase L1-like esterase